MSRVRYIDWSPADWLAGTRGVGMDETAVYITVLNIIYDRADACPNDAGFIAGQMARSGRRRQGHSAVMARTTAALARLIELGKLHVSTDGQLLTNGRAEVELNKARERIGGAHRAGLASGRARRGNDQPMTSQRPPNDQPRGSEYNKINGLTRTGVRIMNTIKKESLTTNSTDAAREPSPELEAAQARAHIEAEPEPPRPLPPTPFEGEARAPPPAPKTKDRLATLAAQARAKLLKGDP